MHTCTLPLCYRLSAGNVLGAAEGSIDSELVQQLADERRCFHTIQPAQQKKRLIECQEHLKKGSGQPGKEGCDLGADSHIAPPGAPACEAMAGLGQELAEELGQMPPA